MFTEYEHMQNHYNAHFDIEQCKADLETKWIATEKIHGTNYSFLYNPSTGVIPCRRSGLLSSDPAFFNHLPIFNKYKNDVVLIYNKLKETYPTLKQIQLYGELFGGLYNGKTSQSAKKVQKGIEYNLENDFMAFDLKISYDTITKYLDWDVLFDLLSLTTIKHVPIMKEGIFQEMLLLNPSFESVVYSYYGLPKIESNLAEGYVIKPIKEIINSNAERSERIIFKFKNPRFSEIAHGKSEKTKTVSDKPNYGQLLLPYLTDIRYDNVFAKQSSTVTREELINALVEDIKIELNDNNRKENEIVFDETLHKILISMVTNFIKKRFYREI
jgi:Rnl2 family RNA ligase